MTTVVAVVNEERARTRALQSGARGLADGLRTARDLYAAIDASGHVERLDNEISSLA